MFKIALPNPSEFENDIPSYFSQMRVVIKAAEISYKEATKNLADEEKKEFHLTYRFPKIDLYERDQDEKGFVKVHVDEEGEQMQNIELEIFN